MFKRLRVVIGINTALAHLGVNTQKLNPTWRRGCQEIALNQGLPPKAVAAYMFYQLPLEQRPSEGLEQIERWLASGELSGEDAEYARSSAIKLRRREE